MIGKLSGAVSEICDNSIILEVGGVGYEVFVTSNLISKASGNLSLFIITHVREDHIHLYGFEKKEEKDIFLALCKVNGVGNKLALSILSELSLSEISSAINLGDKFKLKSVSGVGAKIAERIIMELKGKIFHSENVAVKTTSFNQSILFDAVSALSNLGISKMIATEYVQKILETNTNSTLDGVITEVLRKIAK